MARPIFSGAPDRPPVILIVDDDPAVVAAMELLFAVHELPCVSASSPDEALRRIEDRQVALVLQDMNYAGDLTSGREGAALFRQIRARRPELPVILMTAWASLEMAVALVKEGAADYIEKPWDDDKLVEKARALLPVPMAQGLKWPEGADLAGFVYASPAVHDAVLLALRVAPSDAPVLIMGENGSGKDGIASIIHQNSRRKRGPFVRVDVGALPETLLEAELFGAEPGAYTGAARRRAGCFEVASGGTLFLDEIGNLSLAGQAKLLRVLQTGEFQRLGSSETRRTDVRVVAATNVDLPAAVRKGAFREDLYFRLAVIEIRVPPLRERPEDIPVLADLFLAQHAEESREIGPEALSALMRHSFPGNVRELQNRIRRAALVAPARTLSPRDLGLDLPGPPPEEEREDDEAPVAVLLTRSEEEERRQIEAVLDSVGGVVARAAAQLGMSRQALYRRMRRLGLAVERRVKDA
ncbi:MAG: sigma-54-dependent Fis family transcriptional regulator [Polyangiaceae bacterium]|nr:sigma-54-dependent Fis family transcriptional regulator [Polyangiaceae bacterium]